MDNEKKEELQRISDAAFREMKRDLRSADFLESFNFDPAKIDLRSAYKWAVIYLAAEKALDRLA